MGTTEKMDQIAGIFSRHDVPFQISSDQDEFRVLRGSCAVFIQAREWDGGTLVHLNSPVVIDFPTDQDSGKYAEAHMICNDLNRDTYFAKFVVYDNSETDRGIIEIELDLLGNDMQASELLNALDLVSGLSDRFDDELAKRLGGRRYEDVVPTGSQHVTET